MSARWDDEHVPPTRGRDFLLGLLFLLVFYGLQWIATLLGNWAAGPTP